MVGWCPAACHVKPQHGMTLRVLLFTAAFPSGSHWPAGALSDPSKGRILYLLSSGDLVSRKYSLWACCSSNTKNTPQFDILGREAIFIISRKSITKMFLLVWEDGWFGFLDSRNASVWLKHKQLKTMFLKVSIQINQYRNQGLGGRLKFYALEVSKRCGQTRCSCKCGANQYIKGPS